MTNGLLLWADDEMELLAGHVLFLEKKGYEVVLVSNGNDAIEQCQQRAFDLVILDEMMPGLSGLETLQRIKDITPSTPIIMVTKSEEEHIMDQAIGKNIADYLIKPVNPNQILLSCKKNIHRRAILSEVAETDYQQQFAAIAAQIAQAEDFAAWVEVYRRLVSWEMDLAVSSPAMSELLAAQKEEANAEFVRFIRKNYLRWVNPATFLRAADRPLMSPDIFKQKVFPLFAAGDRVFVLLIDNLRFDQWRSLSQEVATLFSIDEDLYLSVLPTATQYARNAIFAGLMPDKIAQLYPSLWVDEDEDEGKNLNEGPLIGTQLERFRRHETYSYHKVSDAAGAERYLALLPTLIAQHPLNVLVVNFIDMLSHARTEVKMVRELAADESAYRALTLAWAQHSLLATLLPLVAAAGCRLLLTTDHGSIRCSRPVKIIGDRNTNTNLRYKLGRNLAVDDKQVYIIREPAAAQLPAPNLSTAYVFATGNSFLCYPNNYNYYVAYYRDTFQHGGISMEEMLVPLVTLTPKH